jgi:hypothetical protein
MPFSIYSPISDSNPLPIALTDPIFDSATVTGDLTVGGSVLVGSATGGMPAAGVINAKGFTKDGVPVGESTDTYWSPDGSDIEFTTGEVACGLRTEDTTLGLNGPNLGSSITARAIAPGLVFNGTTESAGTISTALGTADKSLAAKVQLTSAVSGVFHIGTSAATVARQLIVSVIAATRKVRVEQLGATTSDIRQANTDSAVGAVNEVVHIVASVSSGTLTIYVNGVSVPFTETTAGTPPAWTDTVNGTTVSVGGLGGAGYNTGYLTDALIWNRALSAAEVKSLYESGPSGADFNSAGTTATSGTLVIGKKYRLTDWITNDDFTNVGAASNADGVEFVATGTTPTTWTNSSVVTSLGLVLANDYAVGSGLTVPPLNGTSGTITLPASGVSWSQPNGNLASFGTVAANQATIAGDALGGLTIAQPSGKGITASGTGPHVFGTTNTVTLAAGTIKATAVAEHADNAAAVTAGLAVGTFYRTGDVLKVVH